MQSTFVALLRGINVGGKHCLPMKQLVELFNEAGCKDVGTYIQSGNVVFQATAAQAKRVPGLVSGFILRDLGFQVPVILRSREEFLALLEANPYGGREGEENLHLLFLADTPAPDRVTRLDGARSLPDSFQVRGKEVYLRLPNGVGKTNLTNAYFDAQLRTVGTLRNWRTVLQLAAMVGL